MIWSDARRFCFVHIPKTAGIAIRRAYARQMLFGDVVLGRDPTDLSLDRFYAEHFGLGTHSAARRIALVVGAERFRAMYSVAVVRDPVARMVSYFRWLHGIRRSGRGQMSELHARLAAITDFEAFAHEAAASLGSQAHMVTDTAGRVMVSRLIRHDRVAEGWAEVCARVGIPDASLTRSNESRGPEVEVGDSVRAFLRQAFAADYDLLYAPGGALCDEPAPPAPARPAAALELRAVT